MADVKKPADTWVFIDEDYRSINDGGFGVVMIPPGSTTGDEADYPAGYHGGAGGFSFADGHAAIHKWNSPKTYTPVSSNPPELTSSDPGFVLDMIWLSSETTVPVSGYW